MDVLVSTAVVGLLIALMLPALQTVKERAHRAICQSNLRQIGLGVAMYAQDHEEFIPPSVFVRTSPALRSEMMTLQLDTDMIAGTGNKAQSNGWDGLGILYGDSYLNGPKTFYCPSHHGQHPYSRYERRFSIYRTPQTDPIISNYHYRGIGPNDAIQLNAIRPQRTSLIADGMRTELDYNHREGSNVLRADMSLFWFADAQGALLAVMAGEPPGGARADDTFERAWDLLDTPVRSPTNDRRDDD